MSEPIKIQFKFADGLVHNASVSEASEAVQICFNYTWLLVPKSDSLDQAPTYSFEISDDNITWQPYAPETLDAAINQPFDDTHFPPVFVRINYNAQTNTTGTVSFDLTLKR